jgi:hypothetical protein
MHTAPCTLPDMVPWLHGGRAWALGLTLGATLSVLFVIDYASGRAMYSAFASYHAYLEFPCFWRCS